jgi:hypothetical protein
VDYERAKEIVGGRLEFGNPEHIEAVAEMERHRERERLEAAAFGEIELEVQVLKNPVTGEVHNRVRVLP